MMRLSPYQTARLKLQLPLAQALAADMYGLATKNWIGKSFENASSSKLRTQIRNLEPYHTIPFFPSFLVLCCSPHPSLRPPTFARKIPLLLGALRLSGLHTTSTSLTLHREKWGVQEWVAPPQNGNPQVGKK